MICGSRFIMAGFPVCGLVAAAAAAAAAAASCLCALLAGDWLCLVCLLARRMQCALFSLLACDPLYICLFVCLREEYNVLLGCVLCGLMIGGLRFAYAGFQFLGGRVDAFLCLVAFARVRGPTLPKAELRAMNAMKAWLQISARLSFLTMNVRWIISGVRLVASIFWQEQDCNSWLDLNASLIFGDDCRVVDCF